MKKFKKIFAFVMIAALGMSFTACSDDALNTDPYNKSGVNLLAFGPCPMERTHEIRITGTNMNKVDKVVFPHDATTQEAFVTRAEFNKSDNENIYLNIPDATVPGAIKLVVGKDTITSEGILTFEEPISVVNITPTIGLKAGDIITVKGDYVYNIASITFTSGVVVPAEEFISTSRRELQIQVPLAAQSGTVTLSDGADWTLEYADAEGNPIEFLIETVKVTSLSTNAADFGDVITIYGENLDLISEVCFPSVPGVEFTVAADGKSMTVTVPATATSGDIVLISYSGLTTSVAIEVPLISYEAGSITPVEELAVGDKVTFKGTLLDRVTKLVLPGDITLEKGEFEQSATEISFLVPEGMGDGKVKIVQHENYSVETDKIAMHHDGAENIIWSGSFTIDGWNGNQDLAWGGYDWSNLKAGDEIIFYVDFVDPTAGWACLSPRMGQEWGNLSVGQIDFTPSAETQRAVFKVTEEDVNHIQNDGGLVITGTGIILKQVAMPIPQIIAWSGTFDIIGWAGCQDLAWGGYDWSTFQAGQKIIFTVGFADPTAGWACISPRMGQEWGNLSVGQIDFTPSAEDQTATFIPTAEDIEHLQNDGGLVITGDGCILKQVVIQ